MIEITVRNYLLAALSPTKVYAEEPDDDSKEYVVIEKTGSSEENHINTSTIAIKSYGASLYDAMVLNERVKAAMEDIEWKIQDISDSSLDSDYNFSDTSRKKYRYQAVFNLTHY